MGGLNEVKAGRVFKRPDEGGSTRWIFLEIRNLVKLSL